jgi:hypothetical protein
MVRVVIPWKALYLVAGVVSEASPTAAKKSVTVLGVAIGRELSGSGGLAKLEFELRCEILRELLFGFSGGSSATYGGRPWWPDCDGGRERERHDARRPRRSVAGTWWRRAIEELVLCCEMRELRIENGLIDVGAEQASTKQLEFLPRFGIARVNASGD